MGASLPAVASAPDQAKTKIPPAQSLWGPKAVSPSYSQLLRDLRAGRVSELELSPLNRQVQVSYRDGQRAQVSVFSNDQQLLQTAEQAGVPLSVRDDRQEGAVASLVANGLLVLLLLLGLGL